MLRQREPRVKDEKHLRFIRSLYCCVCGHPGTEAAHVRLGDLDRGKRPTGIGEKPSDKFSLPLCNQHHREQHSMGEGAFWTSVGIDPIALCVELHAVSGDAERAETIIRGARMCAGNMENVTWPSAR